MRVLSVASEVFPLVKTGGLADVAGALPPALSAHGIEVRTLLPGYRRVLARLGDAVAIHAFDDLFGTQARLLEAKSEGLDLVVLDAPSFFDRDGGPYAGPDGVDFEDNWRRFAALSAAAAAIAGGALEDWQPDLVHAHDWQAAMAPVYMRYAGLSVPSLVTVHNLAFQGQFPAEIFADLGLPADAFALDGVEYYGGVGYLKGGLASASAITTVSPTYAREITTPEFGMGLDGLIRAREGDLHGIVNGIDTEVWNPASDAAIAANYSSADDPARAENRAALVSRLALDDDEAPIFAMVGRLTWQKGLDVLLETLETLVAGGGKLAILGTGDPALEAGFRAAAESHRGRVAVEIGYDEGLSHLMQAGADALVVPSRFEPCGLTQLCALRYGSVPIVARTGGLADTIVDANEAALSAGVATGFQFSPVDAPSLAHALARAMNAFARPETWTRMRAEGMKANVSWDRSAARYADLYRTLIERG
ncbi:glycogen synthase GlgA [Pararhizobium mangrovi]|uniref:Glycogen synthase n=1 Tax=Pararhizobium mangrovi TaxID=2590452 RepID=A0A506U6H5_9HYPH|nr:glycogen synthase GlgA [Pararhizobium mangrovi]TPW29983.1 glycogen synthase GlgA [Pararhizobium mangrovi]